MLNRFRETVKDFSSSVKETVAEKELEEDDVNPLLDQMRLKLLQSNVSLEAAESIEEKIRENLLGESVPRTKVDERVNDAVKDVLLKIMDDSYDFSSELERAEKPPVVFMIGFNGSGKCVSGDTSIFTDKGPIDAEDLFEKYSHLERTETEKGEYVEPEDLIVNSVNQDNLGSELKQASKIWKLPADELMDIKFSTAKNISVTPEHPFFSIKEGAVVKQSAETLSEGDYVMAPSEIRDGEYDVDYWAKLEKGYYVESQEVIDKIYASIDEEQKLEDIEDVWTRLGYHSDAIQYWRRSSKVPLEVVRALGIDIPQNAAFAAPEAKKVNLPRKPSEDFAEWLGMFIAEGNIDNKAIHIHNKDEDFIQRLKQLYESVFSLKPTITEQENLYRVSVGKATLSKYLEDTIGMKDSKHSLLAEVVKWSNQCLAAFLKGFFSGDGHVNTNQREIELVTSCEETADRIQYMLLCHQIISSKDIKMVDGANYFRLRINGDSKLRKWEDKIGFSIQYKNEDLKRAIARSKQYEHTELVPNQSQLLRSVRKSEDITQKLMGEKLGVGNTMIHHYENDSRIEKTKLSKYAELSDGAAEEFLEKLSSGDVSWLKVENIKRRTSKEAVYDLTVPDNHNFVANGLVIHNTTTAAKIGNLLQKKGEEVVLGAGDTFRAASIEQLKEHGEALGAKVVAHEYESDPAAVGYDTVEHAKKNDKIALIDTAGRSHADKNLMGELEKMVKVNNPDITFLVIDALAGNDILEQAEAYEGMYDAVIVTKMDVDEAGGAIISISERSGKPVAFLGTGQGYEDLEKFDKEEFVEEILE